MRTTDWIQVAAVCRLCICCLANQPLAYLRVATVGHHKGHELYKIQRRDIRVPKLLLSSTSAVFSLGLDLCRLSVLHLRAVHSSKAMVWSESACSSKRDKILAMAGDWFGSHIQTSFAEMIFFKPAAVVIYK